MKRFGIAFALIIASFILCFSVRNHGVSAQTISPIGSPAPALHGNGAPPAAVNQTCNSSLTNVLYYQNDGGLGMKFWFCDGTAWTQNNGAITLSGTSAVITWGLIGVGACSQQTITISGAAVGQAAYAAAIGDAGDGNARIRAWVSAANTVTLRACNYGLTSLGLNAVAWKVIIPSV